MANIAYILQSSSGIRPVDASKTNQFILGIPAAIPIVKNWRGASEELVTGVR